MTTNPASILATLFVDMQWAVWYNSDLVLTNPSAEFHTADTQSIGSTHSWLQRLVAAGFEPCHPQSWFEHRLSQVCPPTQLHVDAITSAPCQRWDMTQLDQVVCSAEGLLKVLAYPSTERLLALAREEFGNTKRGGAERE